MKAINKLGINKPIICKRCGHKVGTIRLKWRFKAKLIILGFFIGFATQIPAQLISDMISHYLLGY